MTHCTGGNIQPFPGITVPTHTKPFKVNDNFTSEGGVRVRCATDPTSQGRRAHTPLRGAFEELALEGVSDGEKFHPPRLEQWQKLVKITQIIWQYR